MFFFQLPRVPERFVRGRGWHFFRESWLKRSRPGAISEDDIARYVEAWEQPGAITAMIDYYRAVFRQRPSQAEARVGVVRAPTLVVWGERDRYLGPELAEPDRADVPNLQRVVRLPDATHWVQHDEPQEVNRLLAGFFGAAPATGEAS